MGPCQGRHEALVGRPLCVDVKFEFLSHRRWKQLASLDGFMRMANTTSRGSPHLDVHEGSLPQSGGELLDAFRGVDVEAAQAHRVQRGHDSRREAVEEVASSNEIFIPASGWGRYAC